MTVELRFAVEDVAMEPGSLVPTLIFRLRITEETGADVGGAILQAQVRVEPTRRRYSEAEAARLYELFDQRARWPETMRSLLWTHVAVAVPAFRGETRVALRVDCSADPDLAVTKYFAALEGAAVPIVFLFSGTVFVREPGGGLRVAFVPWESEARFDLPVARWAELMEKYFGGRRWLAVERTTFEALRRYKEAEGLATWNEVVRRLMAQAGVES